MKKTNTNIENNFNININKDDPTINDFLYCWQKFGTRPNRLTIFNSYSASEFNNLIYSSSVNKNINTEIIPAENESIVNDQIFIEINKNIALSYIVLNRNSENSTINELIFYYKSESDYSNVVDLIEQLDKFSVSYEEKNNYKLNTISINQNTIEIEPLVTQEIDESIELHYSDKTYNKVEKLVKSIKKSKKGLSILYGERGTGKTSIINYLSTKLDRIVIFIPTNLIEQTINNSDFRKFLKKHYRPIIVIDDCEMLFNEVFAKSNIFVNNLLQMVDGFLSDTMEVNIVSIFNVDNEDEIDHSLLDCNNLLDVIKFDLLSEEESNELSKHLGSSKKYKTKTRLVDIVRKRNTKETYEIGF